MLAHPDRFARLGRDAISVYETPGCGLLDKRSIKLESVQDFEWSPAEPLLAAYAAEENNSPARILLMRLPEREDVRQKNLFSVSGEWLFGCLVVFGCAWFGGWRLLLCCCWARAGRARARAPF